MKKLLLLIAVFALLIPAGLTACKQQPETKTFKVMHEEKFGGIYFDSTIDAFNALGFSYGDSVDIEFSNGTSMKDLPYYNGYYVDIGDPLLVAYPGYPRLVFGDRCRPVREQRLDRFFRRRRLQGPYVRIVDAGNSRRETENGIILFYHRQKKAVDRSDDCAREIAQMRRGVRIRRDAFRQFLSDLGTQLVRRVPCVGNDEHLIEGIPRYGQKPHYFFYQHRRFSGSRSGGNEHVPSFSLREKLSVGPLYFVVIRNAHPHVFIIALRQTFAPAHQLHGLSLPSTSGRAPQSPLFIRPAIAATAPSRF